MKVRQKFKKKLVDTLLLQKATKSMMIKPNGKNLADTHFYILIMTEALIEQSHYCELILLADEFFYFMTQQRAWDEGAPLAKKANKMLNIMNQK